ncbi:MAG: type II toxin-antitoxin system RelE/ParE family toxin [Desulfobulbus sp.]|jgi:putative addiction module killer protein|uniref:type II toxin-antitoxin system RelE/ParE family toxin n=1 Tax=Desulfobulbus sp. TaxID=895 RepID=UPI0028502495|nr:type II toxin-antitoxin system RelE/ParE family toxin [Desulfobulbus sp.]MDR2550009.1 type II toxin-antitoxin system RelE/ParE family toxin [Desulfobulbus sp.]
MKYELRSTEHFNRWLSKVRDKTTRARIFHRLDAVAMGSFGDHKALSTDLFELRLFFGPGYRIYYTIRGKEIVLLLTGGDKSTQAKDIVKAAKLMEELED